MSITLTIHDDQSGLPPFTTGFATVSGSTPGTTNAVYGSVWNGTTGPLTWTEVGNRIGDGVVPLVGAWNFWYAFSSTDNVASPTVYQPLTASPTAKALEDLLADAIVSELNQSGQPWTSVFGAESAVAQRTRYPVYGDDGLYTAEQLTTLKIAVIPLKLARDRTARVGRKMQYQCDVELIRAIEPKDDANLVKFSMLAQEIHDHFDDGHLLLNQPAGFQPNWCCLRTDRPDVYSMDDLIANRMWYTSLSVTIQGYKP